MAHTEGRLCRNIDPVALDGTVYIEEDDDHIRGAGAVGVWTEADSVTAFDDISYSSGTKR